jgi:hypothetical protein
MPQATEFDPAGLKKSCSCMALTPLNESRWLSLESC